jgi:hypothetical protein
MQAIKDSHHVILILIRKLSFQIFLLKEQIWFIELAFRNDKQLLRYIKASHRLNLYLSAFELG